MPVIIRPRPTLVGVNQDRPVHSVSDLLSMVSHENRNRHILRTSFLSLPDGDDEDTRRSIVPYKNGLVHTVLRAFQQDLHLTLRPDDVWLAILTQFTFFVNGRAEELRSSFVTHEQREKLVLDMRPQTLYDVDIGLVARNMADLVKERLVDPEITSRLLPEFTTTTEHDRSTAAMVFLGSTQRYFHYVVQVGCGFPSVTLLGERSDWTSILERVTWFAALGNEEAVAWSRCLGRVLMGMVASFDAPEADETRDFWMRACYAAAAEESGGPVTLSGWLTAFCWWRVDGARQKAFDDVELLELGASRLPNKSARRLVLEGVEFPIVARDEIPSAVAQVPLKVLNADGEEIMTVLLAGLIGMEVKNDAATEVQPASGWWMLGEIERAHNWRKKGRSKVKRSPLSVELPILATK